MTDEVAAEGHMKEELGIEQGGGPPTGTPWTLVVPDEGWSADLEHASPIPCVGDRIEYIGERGDRRFYRVSEVVHTLQPSASERPRVGDERRGPNAVVDADAPPEAPRELRAGLPRVIVTPAGTEDAQARP